MKKRTVMAMLLVGGCLNVSALDPQMTEQDHIRMRQQQRRDYAENQKVILAKQHKERKAVINEMSASPFDKQDATEKENSTPAPIEQKRYIRWIILGLFATALLAIHYFTRKNEH